MFHSPRFPKVTWLQTTAPQSKGKYFSSRTAELLQMGNCCFNSVQGPNSLWHIDGHHSLVNWGFVIHRGIDGFSRLIVYLHCSTNNRKEVVTHRFCSAIVRYYWPSRVRSDHCGENVEVWQLMEEVCDTNR